jgi:hypothetical protein
VDPFNADVNQRSFTVTGTVVSVRSGSLRSLSIRLRQPVLAFTEPPMEPLQVRAA